MMWQEPRMRDPATPITIIKDEDITYQGRTLSVQYEEGRLQAIYTAANYGRGRSTQKGFATVSTRNSLIRLNLIS